MSHRGSLLLLPGGARAWEVADVASLVPESFAPLFAEKDRVEIAFLGSGAAQIFPGREVIAAFADLGIGIEVMSTGSAARTYNVLLAEGRRIAAALIAVA
jgi:uncharacterized protein